jgi:hypothetical protein
MNLLQKTADALRAHGFDAYTVKTKEEACALALSFIEKTESVTWGGSATIAEIGLIDALKKGGYLAYDRESVSPSERNAFAKAHFFSDWYLMSTNALTETGELLNMDGNGNRAAALVYGPRQVIVVAGLNKVAKDLDAAIARVRGTAAPTNAQRFPVNTPCKITGVCADCKSPDCICANMVITRLSKPAGKIKVILIGEMLGM